MSVLSTKRSQMALKEFLEFDASSSTAMTEQISVCSDDENDFTPYSSSTTKVRFAESSNGDVEYQVHEIEKISDPAHWWQDEELADIRKECSRLLEQERSNPRGIRKATIQCLKIAKRKGSPNNDFLVKMGECSELRGLEFYAVPECKRTILKHVQTVVDMQVLKVDNNLLKLSSSTRSRIFTELALQRASYDAAEARDACRTPWTSEEEDARVCLD